MKYKDNDKLSKKEIINEITIQTNEKFDQILSNKLLNEIVKNKDILLQVRIDEQYNKKINILENYLKKNRSEIIRTAIDNLFDKYILENQKIHNNENDMKIQKIQEEVILLISLLEKIYETNDVEKYIKALKIKLDILEERSKK